MLRPDVKAAWTAALRSGDYVQGFGALYDAGNGGNCCLGVLGCELVAKFPDLLAEAGWAFDPNAGEFYRLDLSRGDELPNTHATELPGEVAHAVGLIDGVGQHPLLPNNNLANYNDDDQLTFDEIADLIEEMY